jgi:hypothetical protein
MVAEVPGCIHSGIAAIAELDNSSNIKIIDNAFILESKQMEYISFLNNPQELYRCLPRFSFIYHAQMCWPKDCHGRKPNML